MYRSDYSTVVLRYRYDCSTLAVRYIHDYNTLRGGTNMTAAQW